jgi:hypothetical protein
MALPDYFKIQPGTAIIWGQPSAAGVTKNLTLDNLAAAAGRQGVYADLGAEFDEELGIFVVMESGTAPTAGGLIEVYFACAHASSGFWPLGVDGTDSAYTVTNKSQLGAPVSLVPAINSGNVLQAAPAVIWRPPGRYIAPVVINNWSQNIRNETTDTDNDSRVIAVPMRYLIQDAA